MGKIMSAVHGWDRRIDRIWEEEASGCASGRMPAGANAGRETDSPGAGRESVGRNADQRACESKRRPAASCRERLASFVRAHRWELLFVLFMGSVIFAIAWILPFNQAPDEEMRYMVPTYIYRHGTLPAGYDPEIRNEIWGISYGFHPILPYIFGGYLMKLVGIFNSSDKALLMAARFINVLIGMGFYWYVLQIAKKLFGNRLFRAYFVALLALLPQLLYLFAYVNTDAIAVFSSAMLIHYWLQGLERKWDRGSCTGLAVGVSVCALSYFNAYGYALFSVIIFVSSLLVRYARKGAKYCAAVILKRGIYITVIVFLLTGWWFIRCAVLYDGDFLGLYAPDKYGEMYAMEEFKPSVKLSLDEQGVPLDEMLRPEDQGGMEWIRTTYRSTIGYFGYFDEPLGIDIYEIHKRLLGLGVLGMLLYVLTAAGRWCLRFGCRYTGAGRKSKLQMCGNASGEQTADGRENNRFRPEPCPRDIASEHYDFFGGNCKISTFEFLLLQFSFGCCIIIPVLLSLYYSYFTDFQPQGRYIMPLIVPLMYFIAKGTERFITLFFHKWMVYVMMIPQFWAVLHVFLGAYVSVFLPAYVEELAFLANVRFPWCSNIGPLMRLIQMLIPG